MNRLAIIFALCLPALCHAADPIADNPWTSDPEIARSPFGVALETGKVGQPLEDVKERIKDKRGVGITVPNDGRILDSISAHCYVGAKLTSSDAEISRGRLTNNRDVGLWISAGAGNCTSLNNHCHGARIACYNEGGQQFRAVNDTYADSFVGYFGDSKVSGSHQTTLTNILFQHNLVRDCVFTCTSGHLVNCIVNVQEDVTEWSTIDISGVITRSTAGPGNAKVGVELASRCSIRDGVVELAKWHHPLHHPSGKPSEAIRVIAGSELVNVETLLVEWQGVDGAVGVHTVGPCHSLKIDCMVFGFDQPASRLLIIDDASHTNADVTFRLNVPATKPIASYVTTGKDWSGSIRVIGSDGTTATLAKGKPTK